jgi:hypothetical protein
MMILNLPGLKNLAGFFTGKIHRQPVFKLSNLNGLGAVSHRWRGAHCIPTLARGNESVNKLGRFFYGKNSPPAGLQGFAVEESEKS